MTVLPILPIEHPLLRKRAKPVAHFDAGLKQLVDDMFATLHEANGVGLAAPQISKGIRLFVAEFQDQRLALCNPVVTAKDGETVGSEGCLSLPGFVGLHIRRAARIEVEGQDLHGAPVSITATGVFARILQHEIDHLDGILFMDHLESPADLRPIPGDDPDETTSVAAAVTVDSDS